ncbi:MAG: hypothetical protein WD007_00080, partial [Nitriliruptoraceae bacterium]
GGVDFQLARVGSMMTLFFAKEAVVDWETASRCDTARFARWFATAMTVALAVNWLVQLSRVW